MLRFLGEFVSFLFFILVMRSVVTGVWRLLSGTLSVPNPAYQGTQTRGRGGAAPVTGELRKDPVCGTFVATSTAWRREAAGKTNYYCSKECFEKDSKAKGQWEKSTAARS